MKFIFPIVFFLFSNTAYSQVLELQGIYHGKNGERITFMGKDSFHFEQNECKSTNYGKGKCRIVNDLMYLNFEKSINEKELGESFYISKSTRKNIDNATTINFIAIDNKGELVKSITTKTEYEKEKIIRITNDSTFKEILIKKTKDSIKFTIDSLGFKSIISKLESGYNYKIILHIIRTETFDIKYNKGEKFVYEIEEISENSILMRHKNSKEGFVEYRKIIKTQLKNNIKKL